MRLQGFDGTMEFDEPEELEAALVKRHGAGVNSFWLSHGQQLYPALAILVKGDMAHLDYFPADGHAGYSSIGRCDGLDPAGITVFVTDSMGEEAEVLNSAVVPFSTALNAAKGFLYSNALTRNVEWLEL